MNPRPTSPWARSVNDREVVSAVTTVLIATMPANTTANPIAIALGRDAAGANRPPAQRASFQSTK